MTEEEKKLSEVAYCDALIKVISFSKNVREIVASVNKDILISDLFQEMIELFSNEVNYFDEFISVVDDDIYECVRYNLFYLLDYIKENMEFKSEEEKINYYDKHNEIIRNICGITKEKLSAYLYNSCCIRFGYYKNIDNSLFDLNTYYEIYTYDYIIVSNIFFKSLPLENAHPKVLLSSLRYILSRYTDINDSINIKQKIIEILNNYKSNQFDLKTKIEIKRLKKVLNE